MKYRILDPDEIMQKGDILVGIKETNIPRISTAKSCVIDGLAGDKASADIGGTWSGEPIPWTFVVRPERNDLVEEKTFKPGDKVRWHYAGTYQINPGYFDEGSVYEVVMVDRKPHTISKGATVLVVNNKGWDGKVWDIIENFTLVEFNSGRKCDVAIDAKPDFWIVWADKGNLAKIKSVEGVASVHICEDTKYLVTPDLRYDPQVVKENIIKALTPGE